MFKKGVSGNPKGKPKGAKDEAKRKIIDFITEIFTSQMMPDIENFYWKLTPKEKSVFIPKIMEYLVAKKREHHIEIDPVEVSHTQSAVFEFPKNFTKPEKINQN